MVEILLCIGIVYCMERAIALIVISRKEKRLIKRLNDFLWETYFFLEFSNSNMHGKLEFGEYYLQFSSEKEFFSRVEKEIDDSIQEMIEFDKKYTFFYLLNYEKSLNELKLQLQLKQNGT